MEVSLPMRLVVVAAVSAIGLSACGGSSGSASDTPADSGTASESAPSAAPSSAAAVADEGVWGAVKAAGVLKTCAVDGLLPYSSSDPDQPGLEVELARALAENLGVTNETVWVGTWDGLIPSLTSGQCDAIVDGLFITDERKKVVDFTDPTWGSGEVIMVRKDDDSISSLEDLKDKCVGALQGSVTVDHLKAAGLEPRIYPTQNEVILDVGNGGCDAAYLESPSAGWALAQDVDLNLKIVDSFKSDEIFFEGIAVDKNQPALLEQLNSAIATVQSDGTLAGILESYGIPVYLP